MGYEIQHKRQQFGPYVTLKVLATGDQSAVYIAMHEPTGKMVALRIVTITTKDVGLALEKCNHVLTGLSKAEIPNTAQIVDFGHEGSVLYIVMDVLNGGTLDQRMKIRMSDEKNMRLPTITDILHMTERLVTALDALHALNMIHGQIQPHSIMFNNRGDAFLTEIGLTRILKIIYNLETTNSFNMTRYSAPELWNGERPSPSTDQYALACIVYQLLTGKAPFDGASIYALMQAHANDIVAPPHYIRDDLSSDLAMVFWQALAKLVDRRYPTNRAFFQDLQHTLTGNIGSKSDFFTFSLD